MKVECTVEEKEVEKREGVREMMRRAESGTHQQKDRAAAKETHQRGTSYARRHVSEKRNDVAGHAPGLARLPREFAGDGIRARFASARVFGEFHLNGFFNQDKQKAF